MYRLLLLLLTSLSACSVYMASKKEGVDVADVSACKTRGCVHASGATLVSTDPVVGDELIETYKVRKATGSAGRALMHGVLDVATIGLWEVVGTPIEGSMNKEEHVGLKVVSNKDSGEVKRIELLQ